jgi:predicted outer membrane repeat protein
MVNFMHRHRTLMPAGLILVIGAFLLLALPAHAATITVTNSLDSGSGSLRQAVFNASPGDRIVFNPATFNHALTITLSSQIEISKSLTIDGAAGSVVTPTLDGNNAYHRIFLVRSGTVVTLTRLRLINGYDSTCDLCGGGAIYNAGVLNITGGVFISNTSAFHMGGAIYNSGTLTVTGSSFIDNRAAGSSSVGGAIANVGLAYVLSSTFQGNTTANRDGGALHNDYGGVLIVAGSVFTSNTTVDRGAGIFNDGSLDVMNSIFAHNKAIYGGAIFNCCPGTLAVTHSTFLNNQADTGGGIYTEGGSVHVIDSTFTGNRSEAASWGGHYGGAGIYSTGKLTVIRSLFSENLTVNMNGGGIHSEGALNIENSSFISNTASQGAGGGLHSTATGSLTNTTFVSNNANIGGGINSAANLRVVNSSLAHNSSQTNHGGAIAGYSVTLTNTLLAHHPIGGNCAASTVIDGGHNLEDANTCGFTGSGSLTNTNPLLGSPGYYGGSLPTLLLLPGSPAIDAADDNACPATDARGIARPIGSHCDIGAYEAFNRLLWMPVIRH